MRRAAGADEGQRIIYEKSFEYWFSLFTVTHNRKFTSSPIREYFYPIYNKYQASWREVHVLEKIASEINKVCLNVK